MNFDMVRQGMAWWFRRFAAHNNGLARLEAEARAQKRGPRSQPHPVPPWAWHRDEGEPQTAEVIGNRRSTVYHRPACPVAVGMSEADRVKFRSAAEAEAAGSRRAGDCK